MASGFIYFVPGSRRSLTLDEIRQLGFGHAINGDRGVSVVHTTGGPGDSEGLCLTFNPAAGEISAAYVPADQTWRKGPGGKFWVGFATSDKPGPADLSRDRVISGETIELRDGRKWTIPICLSILRGSTLPKALVLGEDCQTWELQTLPEFVKLCRDAEGVWEAFQRGHGGEVTMNGQDAIRIAVDALAVNYRIGPIEASLLGLLSTDSMWSVLKAIVDGFNVERVAIDHAKKNSTSDI